MSKAVTCPVCGGKGKISGDIEWQVGGTTSNVLITCHGCGGKGWVEVSD